MLRANANSSLPHRGSISGIERKLQIIISVDRAQPSTEGYEIGASSESAEAVRLSGNAGSSPADRATTAAMRRCFSGVNQVDSVIEHLVLLAFG
jgi:hypothetical protein